MEASNEKGFSVVIRLSEFSGLNGELEKIQDEQARQTFVHDYFMKNYGPGAGTLEIAQKPNKIRLRWTPAKVDPQAENFHKIALNHAKNRNYVEAINTWVKAISVYAQDPDYYFNLGIAFFEIKNYKEAVENLKNVLKLCPVYYKAHIILGTIYLKIRQFENSEIHLKESIKFYPRHALAYLNLGAVYSILKRYDEAIEVFLKTIEIAPYETRAYFGIGKIYALKNDVDKANYYYQKVIELDQGGQLANHAKRAMVTGPLETGEDAAAGLVNANAEKLYREGYKAYLYADYSKAISLYSACLKQNPNDDFVWFSLGEACIRAGKAENAAQAFQKAVSINANKALYFKELSIALSYLNRNEEVITAVTKSKQLGKSDSITNAVCGKALYNLEKLEDAIATLEEAVRLNTNNLFAKFYLAAAYAKARKVNFATNYLNEIIQAPVNSPLKMEAKELLQSLQGG